MSNLRICRPARAAAPATLLVLGALGACVEPSDRMNREGCDNPACLADADADTVADADTAPDAQTEELVDAGESVPDAAADTPPDVSPDTPPDVSPDTTEPSPDPATCPIAVAACRTRGTNDAAATTLLVAPFDVVDCTGEASSSPGGAVATYQWEVVERPDGSVSRIENPDARETALFLDQVGRYVLRLSVADADGVPSCTPAEVVLRAQPHGALAIDLVWETPGDERPGDSGLGAGADLDLHFLHPNGCWIDRVWDCHFRNSDPNWGDPARTDDNPSTDVDVVDRGGPEAVILDEPELGLTYRVGVHYYNDHGFGASEATVRVYVFGEQVFEETRTLAEPGAFWEVASIAWPSATITALRTEYDGADVAIEACEARRLP